MPTRHGWYSGIELGQNAVQVLLYTALYGAPEISLRQLRTRNAPFDIVAASFDMMRSDAQHDRRRRAS